MDEIRMEAEGGVPVFHPTWEQFESFKDFIDKIEPMGMQTGIVKVVPPQEWLDRVPKIDNDLIQSEVKIKNPIEQETTGTQGVYSFNNILKRRNYTLNQWRKYCDSHEPPKRRHSSREKTPKGQELWQHNDTEFTSDRCGYLEHSYWKTLGFNAPVYAADVQGSLFRDLKEWNVADLDSLLSKLHVKIPGVNTSYIYCGSWKASFAWHLEDMDLHSINYIHFGAPKQWYSIPQADRHRFYNLMKSYWPRDQRKCKEFLRHKNYMVSPTVLEKEGIQVNKIIHRQNEFMITFPYGYHAGFNLGYNLAESVNFATDAWVEIGRASTPCKCVDDNACFDVRALLGEISMEEPVAVANHKRKRGREALGTGQPTQPVRKARRTGNCVLCPHKWEGHYKLVASEDGRKVHEICAKFIPETWIEDDKVMGMGNIPPERYALRCSECKIATGACFQCEYDTCTRAYHPTCAASSGMITQNGKYLCRNHRPKAVTDLEEDPLTVSFACALMRSDPVQCRTVQNKAFAGVVLENDLSEGIVTVQCFPNFDDIIEVPHQWVYPGSFQHIDRPPLIPHVKRNKARKPKCTASAITAGTGGNTSDKAATSQFEVPALPEYKPEPYVPQNMHLYGVEGNNGDLQSPFLFMGVPLPACLQRTTPL